MIPGHGKFPQTLTSQRLGRRSSRHPIHVLSALAVLILFPSCQTVRFYGQAVGGQLEILGKSRPNKRVIADPATSPALRRRLETVEEIRRFAGNRLSLPGNASYGKYADLGREHVVWVLYAAPEFSLKPKTWHYPVLGDLDYRGYFRERDTEALANQLRAGGYDVSIGKVDAYSTLGWFHDPVLNTFVNYPDIDLAETIFHELTHRKLFVQGETVFNECLANTVAEEGVKRWLIDQGRRAELRKYQVCLVRRRAYYREVDHTRRQLETLYASRQSAPAMRRQKAAILAKLRAQLLDLYRRWGGHNPDAWRKQEINNGYIISLKIYAAQMPAFQKLLKDCHGNLDLFFERAAQLKRPGHG